MTKRTVICPKCNTPIGMYPKVRFTEVRLDCWNCGTSLVAKANYILGNSKTPNTISLDANPKYIDDISWDDPTDKIQAKIDRDILLNSLPLRDKKMCIMLEQGYTYREIASEFGLTYQAIGKVVERIRIQLKRKRPD